MRRVLRRRAQSIERSIRNKAPKPDPNGGDRATYMTGGWNRLHTDFAPARAAWFWAQRASLRGNEGDFRIGEKFGVMVQRAPRRVSRAFPREEYSAPTVRGVAKRLCQKEIAHDDERDATESAAFAADLGDRRSARHGRLFRADGRQRFAARARRRRSARRAGRFRGEVRRRYDPHDVLPARGRRRARSA